MFRRRKKTAPRSTSPDPMFRHYRLTRKLGEGGMGVVYEAIDERLRRTVAIKLIRDVSSDPSLRDRLWREARMAAGVSHPNICQVFEVGEEGGELFIAMEYLEGELLGARVKRGIVPLEEALAIMEGILSALGTLHRRGIVHRDLKPSNVFLTEHGVKLLDFGLARPHETGAEVDELRITQTNTVLGTPRYMAPEQWTDGSQVGPACDLFAAGALLYEMLTGEPAFTGRTLPEIFHSIMSDHPVAILGESAIVATDSVVQKALSKRPEDRYPDAEAMAGALRVGVSTPDPATDPANAVRPMKRLIVLPFRLLRPDPDIEFLAFSLPDAITASLSAVDSIIVRASSAVSAATADTLDIKGIAASAGVDAVLCGTLLRAGDQIRVSTQLIEAPSGTILSTRTSQVPMGDIFELQDRLSRDLLDSLSLSRSRDGSGPLQQDVPRSPEAYESYLRANQLSTNMRLLSDARDLYLSSLNEDPHYAPAWARLGRVHRIMAKYGHADADRTYRLAEEAFQMALDINPDLSIAHSLYTQHEVEMGCAPDALRRLLERATNHPLEPEIFVGLVMTCRFCGLLNASVAADRRARDLDPAARTSVSYSYWMLGEYEQAMRHDEDDMRFLTYNSLAMLGRTEEAMKRVRDLESSQPPGILRAILAVHRGGIEQDRRGCADSYESVRPSGFRDPEGIYLLARCLERVGERDRALDALRRCVERGFFCHQTVAHDPWLHDLRETPDYREIDRLSREGRTAAVAIYVAAGGNQLLGVPADEA